MLLGSLKSQSRTCRIEDAAADVRQSRRAGQYRVSDRAVYFPAFPGRRYLPFSAVDEAWVKPTAMPLTGCCGKELPMFRLRLWYDGDGCYQDFLFETEAQAKGVLARVQAAAPWSIKEEAV